MCLNQELANKMCGFREQRGAVMCVSTEYLKKMCELRELLEREEP